MFGIKQDLKLHFVGIGGIGMSGIAEILLGLGYKVSGSDAKESANTEKLKGLGAEIFIGHKSEQIQDVQIIVYSSAIDEKNPEIVEAKKRRLPIIKRAEMLAELMRLKYGVAIAGTHGKTTTTSLLATILKKLEYRPTFIIGGIVKNLGGHAANGEGDILIAEADESDGSFLLLNPIMSVITNIDNDHLDYYGSEENLFEAFTQFANNIPFYGVCSVNGHDTNIAKMTLNIKKPFVTFGVDTKKAAFDSIDYQACDIKYNEDSVSFDVKFETKRYPVSLNISGEHNIQNALAAISIAHRVGADLSEICEAISHFEGVGRRFEKLYDKNSLTVIDDYGHHPTEIIATIEAAKSKYPKKKIILIFEPHRYSRTENLWNEFVHCFSLVDKAFISPIYAASEDPRPGITSDNLINETNKINKIAEKISTWNELIPIFETYNSTETVILLMGAGAISKISRDKLEEWTMKK